MNTPLISIIVPVYKVEKYLHRCINSLTDQTYDNFEIILVDDGSPDKCPEIIDQIAAQHNNIYSFHKINGGLGDARNFGVEKANGDWIVFVDSDDYVTSHYVEDLWNLRTKMNSDIAGAWTISVDENGKIFGKKMKFDPFVVSGKDAVWEIYAGNHIRWAACNKIFPKWVLKKYPFPDGYNEDMACMYKIVSDVKSIAIGDFNENYLYVKYQSGSILSGNLSEKHLHIFDICDEFCCFIDNEYPEIGLLKSLIFVQSTVQLLQRQKMNNNDFNRIFYRNRNMFRKSIVKIIQCKEISAKIKLFSILLCAEPFIYRLVSDKRKRH